MTFVCDKHTDKCLSRHYGIARGDVEGWVRRSIDVQYDIHIRKLDAQLLNKVIS